MFHVQLRVMCILLPHVPPVLLLLLGCLGVLAAALSGEMGSWVSLLLLAAWGPEECMQPLLLVELVSGVHQLYWSGSQSLLWLLKPGCRCPTYPC